MSGRFSLDDFGHSIGLEGAVAYLEQHGWKSRREEDRGQIWFESPPDSQDNSVRLYLPVSEEYADYPARLEELVKAVSILEGRPAIQTVIEMAAASRGDTPRGEILGGTIEDIVRDELRHMEGEPSEENVEAVTSRLSARMRASQLAIDACDFEPWANLEVRQETALIAASLATILPASGESRLLLWRVCSRLMWRIEVELRWIPSQVDEFFNLAKSEGADRLLDWLSSNVIVPARNHEPRKE